MHNIQIATGVSLNFFEPLGVMLTSLAINNRDEKITFHILQNDFLEEDINLFKKLFLEYSKLDIQFHHISNEDVIGLPLLQHFKISTYFRIIAPRILSEHDKILYLDADTIIDGSIKELWETNIDDYVLAAVREESVTALDKRLKMPSDYKYFNAGVILLNAKKIREENKFSDVINYLKENKDEILYLDQDALNAILYDEWLEIDEKWNYHYTFVLKRNEKLINVKLDHPIIIHYTGPLKPWHKECNHVLKERYIYYQSKLFNNVSAPRRSPIFKVNYVKKVIKKIYFKARSYRRLNKILLKLNLFLKNSPFFSKYYYELKERLAPSPQVMSSYQAKMVDVQLPILESSMDWSFFSFREYKNYIQVEGYVFKKGFSSRRTKKFLVFRGLDKKNNYVFCLNNVDHVSLNEIYYDGIDYSKSGFFNFICKKNIVPGKYNIGFLLINDSDDVHFKILDISIII